MSLTPEQASSVSNWVAAGDNLSAIQKKLREQFNIALTYMDVRFLVDDLNLQLKDPPKKVDTSDVSKPQPKATAAPAPGAGTSPSRSEADPDALPGDEALADDEAAPLPGGSVILDVDSVTLIPGAIASGKVTFSDGVTGKWIIDHQGRPGFTEISQPGYRPTPEDAKSFMNQLEAELQRRGL